MRHVGADHLDQVVKDEANPSPPLHPPPAPGVGPLAGRTVRVGMERQGRRASEQEVIAPLAQQRRQVQVAELPVHRIGPGISPNTACASGRRRSASA